MIKRSAALVFALTLLFAFSVPASAAVPSGYTELEYLICDGSQYIDTGIIGKSGIKVSGSFLLSESQTSQLVGSFNGTRFYCLSFNSDVPRYGYINWYNATSAVSVGTKYSYTVDFSQGSQSLVLNGSTVISSSEATSVNTNRALFLGCYNDNGTPSEYFIGRIYPTKIYDGSSLVADYVPAFSPSGVAGFYDNVSSTFISSSGSAFVAGPAVDDGGSGGGSGSGDVVELPDGYLQYEYLESTGNEFLNLNYYPTNNTEFILDHQYIAPTSGYSYPFGSSSQGASTVNPSSERFAYGINLGGSHVQFMIGNTITQFDGILSSERSTLSYVDGVLDYNGNSKTVTPNEFNSAFSMYLFSTNEHGTPYSPYSVMRIYRFQIFENGVLKADLIPSGNGSRFGLYDVVRDNFYLNVSGSADNFAVGGLVSGGQNEVAAQIETLNTQIHDIESAIYDDLHTYSAQVDPSTATNFSGNFLSAMSFISDTWTAAYGQLGDMQVIVTFPLFLAIAMLFIGRMNSVIASGAMKSKKNNDKKGGGDVG